MKRLARLWPVLVCATVSITAGCTINIGAQHAEPAASRSFRLLGGRDCGLEGAQRAHVSGVRPSVLPGRCLGSSWALVRRKALGQPGENIGPPAGESGSCARGHSGCRLDVEIDVGAASVIAWSLVLCVEGLNL